MIKKTLIGLAALASMYLGCSEFKPAQHEIKISNSNEITLINPGWDVDIKEKSGIFHDDKLVYNKTLLKKPNQMSQTGKGYLYVDFDGNDSIDHTICCDLKPKEWNELKNGLTFAKKSCGNGKTNAYYISSHPQRFVEDAVENIPKFTELMYGLDFLNNPIDGNKDIVRAYAFLSLDVHEGLPLNREHGPFLATCGDFEYNIEGILPTYVMHTFLLSDSIEKSIFFMHEKSGDGKSFKVKERTYVDKYPFGNIDIVINGELPDFDPNGREFFNLDKRMNDYLNGSVKGIKCDDEKHYRKLVNIAAAKHADYVFSDIQQNP